MITILDDTITIDECQALIELYHKNENFCHMHNGTFPLNVGNCQNNTDILYPLIEKLLYKIYSVNSEVVMEWIEIVKWPQGTFQSFHVDNASSNTIFSSITYLNDNFEGGNTYIDNSTTIGIKPARTVMFDGMRYIHGVSRINKGTRYTVAAWYKKK